MSETVQTEEAVTERPFYEDEQNIFTRTRTGGVLAVLSSVAVLATGCGVNSDNNKIGKCDSDLASPVLVENGHSVDVLKAFVSAGDERLLTAYRTLNTKTDPVKKTRIKDTVAQLFTFKKPESGGIIDLSSPTATKALDPMSNRADEPYELFCKLEQTDKDVPVELALTTEAIIARSHLKYAGFSVIGVDKYLKSKHSK